MAFDYRIIVEWSAEDAAYIARVPALPGCAAHGDTEAAAVEEARIAAEGILHTMRELGRPTPDPDVTSSYSGKLLLRLPKVLHADLAAQAEAEGVSLNQWVVSRLSSKKAVSPKLVVRRRRALPSHAKAAANVAAKKKGHSSSEQHRKGR